MHSQELAPRTTVRICQIASVNRLDSPSERVHPYNRLLPGLNVAERALHILDYLQVEILVRVAVLYCVCLADY